MKKLFWILILSVMCAATSYGQYNGECWVISRGDTVYKLHANGSADPTVIPNLTQASDAEVNPTNGVAWIAISASNAVFRYDPAAAESFTQAPAIERPNMISVNPADGTIWVAGLNGVWKISSDGTQILAQVIPTGGAPNVETGRFGVAVNPKDGSCWITDARGPIGRYDANGNQVATAPPMKEPKGGVTVDYQGNAWVADTQNNLLVRLSPNGEELARVTELKNPISPSVNPKDGSVWVAANNSMLVNLSPTGKKVKEFPCGMAIVAVRVSPADGGIWVADMLGDTYQGQVSKWTSAGKRLFKNDIPQPSTVSIGYWEEQ